MQNCVPLKDQNGIDYDKLFKDPEFLPQESSIHVEGDIPKAKAILMKNKIRKVRWQRPQEIAPDPEFVGFLKSLKVENPDNLNDANALTESQLIDGQRIFVGEVEDKWFLNALSMAVVEPAVFRELNCLDAGDF